jgi:ABC-type lipoprotein release transport system permease subunit
VGVVGDVHDVGPAQRPRPTLYAAHAQFPTGFVTIVARTREDIPDATSAFRSIVASLDPSLPVFRIRSMNEYASRAVAQPRLYLELLVLFAATAIGLAAVGIYGVMAQTVGARTREIGIRLALGAAPRTVVSLVAGHIGRLAVAGVAGGLLLALLSRTLLSKVLFDVQSLDATTYVVVSLLTGLVALVASWIPARRAARIDPVRTLRAD